MSDRYVLRGRLYGQAPPEDKKGLLGIVVFLAMWLGAFLMGLAHLLGR